jgi:DNA-directed RNA polymerase subunit RPC12/RpoP
MLETHAIRCPHCGESNEFNKETLDTQDSVVCQKC